MDNIYLRVAILIILGVVPSLVWLSYYLRKDVHPEPKRIILKMFIWGALMTLPVFFIQLGLKSLLDEANISPFIYSLIYWFLIISLSEEFFKFLIVRLKIVGNPHFDEPLDIMLYMVVAALGFAALENILYTFNNLFYVFPTIYQISFAEAINRILFIDFIRFIGATFLHTLCSGVIGFALAISFCDEKNKFLEAASGVIMAVALHGLYNFSIMTLEGDIKFGIPVIIILTLAFLVFAGFEKLKRIKSVCKIN